MSARQLAILPCALLTLTLTAPALAAVTHTAIPIPGARDAIIDDLHHQVLVTTETGAVRRHSLLTNSALPSWNVGVNLRGIDLTTDHAFAYIADQSAGPTQGIIRKVSTATGAVTNLTYNLLGEGAGAYDIVRLSGNRMLFTTHHQFSGGATPVRFIDLATDAITPRLIPGAGGAVDHTERTTDLFRSADGTRVFMTGGNTSAGNVRVYDAPSGSYTVDTHLWTPLNGIVAALSPDGDLLSFMGFNVGLSLVRSDDLSLVNTFPMYRSGLGFNPRSGHLVFADWETELFRVYDPASNSYVATFPAGFDLHPFLVGQMIFTADGTTMVYHDINGIHLYTGVPIPEPTTLTACALALPLLTRRRATAN